MSDDILWNSGSWIPNALVDAPVSRCYHRHNIPQADRKDQDGESTVITASVEEKVSELLLNFPQLRAFLKSPPKDPNARVRDLTISTSERDQLLHQIIAARREALFASGRSEGGSISPLHPRKHLTFPHHGLRNDEPKGVSRQPHSSAARR